MIDLNEFKRNHYAQYGEDGLLERLFVELGVVNGTFCEFGAWDGRHLSNTRHLLELGWRGVYIEGDRARYQDLVSRLGHDRAELVCAFVQPEGRNSLDDLLGRSRLVGVSKRLDLLSIDIDSDDLAVWKGLTIVRPRVVIIEFNPTIPLDVEYVNPRGENKGNSAAAIYRFATSKDYDFVAATPCNLVFVDAAFRPRSVPVRPLQICELDAQMRYFWGYDGTLVVARTAYANNAPSFTAPELLAIPWKSALFAQPTPRVFRTFDQSPAWNRVFWAYSLASTAVTRPILALQAVARGLKRVLGWGGSRERILGGDD